MHDILPGQVLLLICTAVGVVCGYIVGRWHQQDITERDQCAAACGDCSECRPGANAQQDAPQIGVRGGGGRVPVQR